MYKMSKKSLIGRIALLPVFLPVIALELILNKADDWSFSVRRLRRRMEKLLNILSEVGDERI
ncbi:hypothetical protein seszw100S_69 [Salmonella phage seszw]|nr:hypothetical protein seszw100S_69 [Salmonella phage seszw]